MPVATAPSLDTMDHVAIPVTDLAATVAWYQEHFKCRLIYQDETWAMLAFANVRLAFVVPSQHPPHTCFRHLAPEQFGPLEIHRDGSRTIYLRDPSGNAVELLAPIT